MGDPKRHRKKFSKPGHPWQKERIEAEKIILNDYGLRRKYEIWKMDFVLKKFLNRAKIIIGESTSQSELEKKQLLNRVYSMGLIKKDSNVEEVLNLTLKDILERRLQTLVHRKNIANTMLQARQFITHENIAIGNKKITSPSYLVSIEEEPHIKITHMINLTKPEVKKEDKAVETKEQKVEDHDKEVTEEKKEAPAVKEESKKEAKKSQSKAKKGEKPKGAKEKKSEDPKEQKTKDSEKKTEKSE